MKKITLITFVSAFILNNPSTLATTQLSEIEPVEPYDNIKVIPLASNKHASDFVIYIKNDVKAHYHKKHTEIIYVLSGKAEMQLDKKHFTVQAGDYIRILPGSVHSVKVKSKEPLKVLSIQTPEFKGQDRVFVN